MTNPEKFQFYFNIDTPGCRSSLALRKRVAETIEELSNQSRVNVGFTISDLKRNYSKLFEVFSKQALKKMGVRLGYAKAVIGQKPFFKPDEFKKLGTKIIEEIRKLRQLSLNEISVDCGLEKEMFTDKELKYLARQAKMHGWGCKGKWSSFDIATDLTIFPCFPHYGQIRFKLSEFKSLDEAWARCNRKKPCYK
jgi:hypothetical protein